MKALATMAHHEQYPIPQAARPHLVLVVDDDAEMRAYIRECLAVLPVRVEEAGDGLDALKQLQANPPEAFVLVITDLVLHGVDGLALKAMLQDNPRWSHVPVLLITGEAGHSRNGPVLYKPFNARKLLAAVKTLLKPS